MKTVRTWCIRILMILFTVIFLYPLFWNLMSAFKTNAEYLTDPYALPTALNLDNFVAAWQKANIAAYFGNSIFVTVFSTVLLLLLVIPISYVLARYRFAGSKLISAIYMACIFLQATYIMIPLFLELQAVNGLNNLPVLCLVYAVMQFPFCIFTLQGFMSAVPRDSRNLQELTVQVLSRHLRLSHFRICSLLQLLSSLPSLSATSITLMLFTCCQTVIRRPKNFIRPVKPISLLHGSLS